jgi:hypothetical protein
MIMDSRFNPSGAWGKKETLGRESPVDSDLCRNNRNLGEQITLSSERSVGREGQFSRV